MRGVWAILRSAFILYKWVRHNRPDIIHAHARIPAFLSNIVAFLTRTPFVTTTHFNFTTDGLIGKLTTWGKRSIAVSDDLKAYLVENYGIVKAAIAEKALPACNITFIEGDEMKTGVSGYLAVLFDQNPQSVGGKLPLDDFYYAP